MRFLIQRPHSAVGIALSDPPLSGDGYISIQSAHSIREQLSSEQDSSRNSIVSVVKKPENISTLR